MTTYTLAKTRYLRSALLNHNLRNTAYTSPTEVYLGLFTADPTVFGTQANELSGNSYARVAIKAKLGDAILETGQISNVLDIAFPAATGDWAAITHMAILDALTSGNMMYFGAGIAFAPVISGDIFTVLVGQIIILER
jgi:hypothetical protein